MARIEPLEPPYELRASARVSDALWQELRGRFDQAQLIELVVLVGFDHTISFVTNALDIEREEGAERFPSVEARRRASRPPP